jgi:endonuclease/exonuclease/phosphatase family metal-dependent hydrolase
MPRHHRVMRFNALVPLLLAACMHHQIPTDKSIETRAPVASAATSLPHQLRIVEFNTHGVTGDVIANAFRTDDVLRDADLIILEEAHRVTRADSCSAACVLGKELGFYSAYAPGHVQDDGTDGVAVVSRAPILSSEVIELPYINVHVNDGRRIALATTLLLDGKPVTVYAVHLENRVTVAERRRQMEPVIAHAAKQTTPVIIAGDFNTSPFTWLAHVIPVPTGTQDDKLEAYVRANGFDTPLAASGPTSHFLGMKLDAIYTRGFSTVAYAVDPAHDVSDHLALWAMLEPR